LRELTRSEEMVIRSEMSSLNGSAFISSYMFPTAVCEESVVCARDKLRSVLQAHPISLLGTTPVVKNSGLHVAAIGADPSCSVKLVSWPDFRESFCPTIGHQDWDFSIRTVRASMKASSIGVEAPAEADVGAFVLGEDASRVFFEDLELGFRRLAEIFDVGGFPGVWRIGDGFQHGGRKYSVSRSEVELAPLLGRPIQKRPG
jgi:hypothetical protein